LRAAARHRFCDLLPSLGVPPRVVTEIVGHSTIEMTMTVHGHVSLDTQRDALGKLDEAAGWETVHARLGERLSRAKVRNRGLASVRATSIWIGGLSAFGVVGLATALRALVG
jgi:hypothetical protein